MKATAKMFGLGKDNLSEEDWTAFVRGVQAVEQNGWRSGIGVQMKNRIPSLGNMH